MITMFLRTKAGVVVMAAFVCAIFFTLSRLKHHRAEVAAKSGSSLQAAPENRSGGAEEAALLKRTQENARGRAETARLERDASRQTGSSYDEAGNVYRRRATPEPMQSPQGSTRSDELERHAESVPESVIVPSLRIHGRKATGPDGLPSLIRNPLETLVPGATVAPRPTPSNLAALPPSAPVPKPQRFLPFGRLIKAELVITLESTEDEMPLIGLVIEPVYNNGKLIIPAGTELHSMARPDRVRDRIISTTTWKLVFPREGQRPNGRQLTFQGIALDRDDGDGNGLTWGLTDGSYGLRGRSVHQGQTAQEVMLFAAEALRAASGTAMDRQATLVGSQAETNLKNAGISGGQAVLEHFAKGLLKEIERNGVYIQVPAGKQFYVYPRQVIDPDRADIPDNIAGVE